MTRPVDLPRVRAALARLDRVALEHPDTRPMPESNLEDLEGFMPEDTMIRIPVQLAERADGLIPLLDKRRDLLAWGRLSRAAVVRIALERGLVALEEELVSGNEAIPRLHEFNSHKSTCPVCQGPGGLCRDGHVLWERFEAAARNLKSSRSNPDEGGDDEQG